MSRRRFLRQAALAAGGVSLPWRAAGAPALVVADCARLAVTHGVAAGDVTDGRATVWSRCDRPARMRVEYDTTDGFTDARSVAGSIARPETGFTARAELTGLPAGQRILYRVSFEDLSDSRTRSEPVPGSFRSAPSVTGDVSFAWSADTVGQGWGINPEWGGLRLYETIRHAGIDFLIHCGDTIYADQPLKPEVTLDDGTVWRNVVTPAKSKVAETLDENVRRLNSEVPLFVLWDDHEVHDNWYPGRSLEREDKYTVKDISLLAARARQAFLEHYPIRLDGSREPRIFRSLAYGPDLEVFALDLRSYRAANSPNRQPRMSARTALLGRAQLRWLKQRLTASRATWKVIASDLPIGLVVPDPPSNFEAFANADGGPPLGRELEVADLLRFLRRHDIRNVVWLTADVHYAAAHHYDPSRARFTDFLPFWEFVAGPMHAGTFGPNPLDATFGPEVRFLGIPPGMKPGRPPSAGLQFFGKLQIEGRTRIMTVSLHDLSGRSIYSVPLSPER